MHSRAKWKRCRQIVIVLPGIVCLLGSAAAQHARPVEVPRLPTLPQPAPVVPVQPQINLKPSLPVAPAPKLAPPPTVVVPGAPPQARQSIQVRPKPCWCYGPNPAGAGSIKLRCAIECCKNDRSERC